MNADKIRYGSRVDITRYMAKKLLDSDALPRPGYEAYSQAGLFVRCAKYTPKGERREYYIKVDSFTESALGRVDDWTGMPLKEFMRRLRAACKASYYPKEESES